MLSIVVDRVYQVLGPDGKLVDTPPDLTPDRLLAAYRWMLFGRQFSDRMIALQRQGRMGTFAPINGQEATAVGLALPLAPDDWIVASYREVLAYMMRGVLPLTIAQVHRGEVGIYPRQANCLPYQIVLGTQMLHAVGVAMGIKYERKPNVVLGVCGDGATSEGDFNEALNFAGVFKAPVVFVVQNNGWAISMPRSRQTAAHAIADRAAGFGMPGVVVDGNDVLAVYKVVAEAVARARAGEGPTLVEAQTYRLGAHTTADDPKKYRPEEELAEWVARDPIPRLRAYLIGQSLLNQAEDTHLHDGVRAEIQTMVDTLEALPPQDPLVLFDNVFETMPPALASQRDALRRDLGRE